MAVGTLSYGTGGGLYSFPCMSGPHASNWNYTSDAIYLWLNTPIGSDWALAFDDEAFREKTQEGPLDPGGFPDDFNGGFTIAVNDLEIQIINRIDVGALGLGIYFDYIGAEATDKIRVKYDKPAEEKWQIPYGSISPVHGVLESFGYTAPILFDE